MLNMANNRLSDIVRRYDPEKRRSQEPKSKVSSLLSNLRRNSGQYLKFGLGLDAAIEGGVRIYQRAAINDIMIQEYLRKAAVITDEVVKSANNLPFDNIWWSHPGSALVGTGMLLIGGAFVVSSICGLAKDAQKQAIYEVLDDLMAEDSPLPKAQPASYNPSDNYFRSS
jgi:hypothetical protein